MLSKFLIYGLFDPRTGELGYIGKSESGFDRPRQHRQPSHQKGKTHRANWLRKMALEGVIAEFDVIESGFVSRQELVEAEKFWISYFRFIGCRLRNGTDGGEGASRRQSCEERLKRSQTLKGRRPSDACMKASILAHRSVPSPTLGRSSPKISEMNRRRWAVIDRRKTGFTFANKRHTLDSRRAMSAAKGKGVFEDEVGNRYFSSGEAAEVLGLNQNSILRVLRGKRKFYHGHTFRYLNVLNV